MESEKEITSTTELEKESYVEIRAESSNRMNTRFKNKRPIQSPKIKKTTLKNGKSLKKNSKQIPENNDMIKTNKCYHCERHLQQRNSNSDMEETNKEPIEAEPDKSLSVRVKAEVDSFGCDECCGDEIKTTSKSSREQPEKIFSCHECDSSFTQLSHLNIHRRTHTGEKPYFCEICDAHFKQISHLKTHVRTHTRDRPYSCTLCMAAFTQNSSLKRHYRSHTGEKPYQCTHCSMTFVVKSNMQRHLNTHTGEKPFMCDLCPSSFGQAIDLKRHKISHTGIKPFNCEVCNASFSRKNNLKWHQRTHSDTSMFKCCVCYVRFATGGDLKAHMWSHAPPKPFKCDICPSSFNIIDSLRRHKMIHTGERPLRNRPKKMGNCKVKPHVCPICEAAFCEKRNMKRHIVSVHGNENLPDVCLSSPKADSTCIIKNETYTSTDGEVTTIKIVSDTMDDEKTVIKEMMPSQQLCIQPIVSASSPQQLVMQQVQSSDGGCQATVPQFLITHVGSAPRPARPAGNCQNHSMHFLTFLEGSYNQWQSWCFCSPQNIPESVNIPTFAADNSDSVQQLVITTGGLEQAAPDSTTYIINPANGAGQSVIISSPQNDDQTGIASLTMS